MVNDLPPPRTSQGVRLRDQQRLRVNRSQHGLHHTPPSESLETEQHDAFFNILTGLYNGRD